MILATQDFTDVNALLSFLVITLLGVIGYLYKEGKKQINEHKEDLKLFDSENKKNAKELLDILNKFYLSLEEGKIKDKDIIDKLQRVISILENSIKTH